MLLYVDVAMSFIADSRVGHVILQVQSSAVLLMLVLMRAVFAVPFQHKVCQCVVFVFVSTSDCIEPIHRRTTKKTAKETTMSSDNGS